MCVRCAIGHVMMLSFICASAWGNGGGMLPLYNETLLTESPQEWKTGLWIMLFMLHACLLCDWLSSDVDVVNGFCYFTD